MSTPSLLNIPYLYKAGTLYSQIPESGAGDFTVTRTTTPTAGQSTRINKDGLIELVADNVPRLDYPLGGAVNGCPALLVEPAATNGIRNNSMVGAVAGSPGTLPTGGGWATILRGLTQTVVGTGTENGINYIDIRFSGTATSTDVVEIRYESNTQIVASSGQTWAHSVYLKKIVEPNPPDNYQLCIYERDSGGGFVAFGASTIAPTTTIQRFTQTRTLSGATTARVQPALFFNVTNSQTYDFTIRIGYPQMELGSVATSVIPTTTAAITRGAEVISKTGATALIGQTEGTLYAEVDIRNLTDGRILTLFNSSTRYILLSKATNRLGGAVIDTTSSPTTIVNLQTASGSLTAGTYKLALAYASGDFAFYVNGTQVATSATGGVIGGYTILRLGNFDTSLFFNDRIRAAALYPNRIPNTAAPGVLSLATLTAL